MSLLPVMAPFAELEARVNRAVFQRLANAVAVVDGGQPFGVIFDREYATPFGAGVVDAAQSLATAPAAAVAGLTPGSVLSVGGTRYCVERIEPDGEGAVRIILYPQA